MTNLPENTRTNLFTEVLPQSHDPYAIWLPQHLPAAVRQVSCQGGVMVLPDRRGLPLLVLRPADLPELFQLFPPVAQPWHGQPPVPHSWAHWLVNLPWSIYRLFRPAPLAPPRLPTPTDLTSAAFCAPVDNPAPWAWACAALVKHGADTLQLAATLADGTTQTVLLVGSSTFYTTLGRPVVALTGPLGGNAPQYYATLALLPGIQNPVPVPPSPATAPRQRWRPLKRTPPRTTRPA